MNSILYTPNVSLQHSQNYSQDSSASMAITPSKTYLANSNFSNYKSQRDGLNIGNDILYRRKFKKTGRTFTLGFSNSISKSEGSGTNISPINFYYPNGTISTVIEQNFESTQKTKSNSNIITTSFTEMFGKKIVMELNYAYTNNHSNSDKDAFDAKIQLSGRHVSTIIQYR